MSEKSTCSACQSQTERTDNFCRVCGASLQAQLIERSNRLLERSAPIPPAIPFYVAFGVYLGISCLYAGLVFLGRDFAEPLRELLGFLEILLPVWLGQYLTQRFQKYLVWGFALLLFCLKFIL